MGKLLYVIGASGAGKDTLMNYARERINGAEKVIFVHRYITRPPFSGNENHVHLTEQEFKTRQHAGLFALHWESHGKFYGIGAEINSFMDSGFSVVVNGSRHYLPVAQQLYPKLAVVMVDASPDIINERLIKRGCENEEEIQKRIARTAQINPVVKNCITILNNGAVEVARE